VKPFPKIHDLYVARVLLGTVLLTWMVLIGLDAVMAMVTELSDVGTGHYGFGSAVAVVTSRRSLSWR
jgi:lipopolysaccharide export system permease protein